MLPNYRVLFAHFGPYRRGDVIPGYWVAVGHNAAHLVERGVIEPTDAEVTVEVVPPAANVPAVSEDVLSERNKLSQHVAELTHENKLLAGKVAELEGHRETLKTELGKHVESAGHLKSALATRVAESERLTAEVARLEAELDAATAPASKKKAG